MVHLAFGYGEVAFLQVGLAVQPSAMQEAERGEDGAERCLHVVYHGVGEVFSYLENLVRCLHVVYHGVGEVFSYLENLVHLRDDADLVDDAGDYQKNEDGCRKK